MNKYLNRKKMYIFEPYKRYTTFIIIIKHLEGEELWKIGE